MKFHTIPPNWYALVLIVLFSIQFKMSHAQSKKGNCKIGASNLKGMPGFKIKSVSLTILIITYFEYKTKFDT